LFTKFLIQYNIPLMYHLALIKWSNCLFP
jgi:hypothetical protein